MLSLSAVGGIQVKYDSISPDLAMSSKKHKEVLVCSQLEKLVFVLLYSTTFSFS